MTSPNPITQDACPICGHADHAPCVRNAIRMVIIRQGELADVRDMARAALSNLDQWLAHMWRQMEHARTKGEGMMPVSDAKAHLDEAMRLLTLEAYRAPVGSDSWRSVDDFTIAEELERIDRALGPKGSSMFARIADDVRSAYVEIKAARQALGT